VELILSSLTFLNFSKFANPSLKEFRLSKSTAAPVTWYLQFLVCRILTLIVFTEISVLDTKRTRLVCRFGERSKTTFQFEELLVTLLVIC